MTEKEQYEHMKEFDYSSLIFHKDNAPAYPVDYVKNAYYGFFLLARSAGNLLEQSVTDTASDEIMNENQLSELALSYLESDCQPKHRNTFLRTKPYTYQLVSTLRDFRVLQKKASPETDYTSFVERINSLIKHIESTRISENLLRSLDIRIAKRWCRILRIYCFLRIPEGILPHKYCYERDLHICTKRGLNQEETYWVDFRVRFLRFQKQEKVGKLILLAEEWEMLCAGREITGNPYEYELMVLALLDSDLFYKIGLEWVAMLVLRCPDNDSFRKWEARYLRRDGRYKKAHEVCFGLIKKNPEDYELYCLQSNLYFLEGKYKQAQRSALQAVVNAEDEPVAHMTLAYAYLYDGIYEEAIDAFDKSLLLDASLIDAYRGKSKALIMDGQAYEAMECLISVSRISPDDSEIFHDLADVYFMCGYLDECRKYCRKCLAIDPECAGAFVLLGMLEIRKNHEDHAGKWLNRALEIDPQNPIALNELAFVQHMNGNDDECLRLLQKAIDIAPDFPDVLCSMGVVYYYQSEFDEALDYFDRTLELEPAHVGALIGKGNLFLAQSDAEEALLWYDMALAYDPEYPEAIHGKVSAYRALGLEQEAFEWMQKASDMGIDQDDED